jgi:dTDP-glucose 4,6-dehydratase/UDP-glucose 4-epimerase
MTILVLGSEGFIGSHICDFFHHGHTVIGFDTSTNPRYPKNKSVYYSNLYYTTEQIFESHRIDVCINAAGSANVGLSVQNPAQDFESNTVFTFQVLNVIKNKQPDCQYVHISSAAVYGTPLKLPIQESDPLQPISPYGWHKLHAENICKEFHLLYQIPIAILRPFSVYGPRLKKQLFWDLFQKSQSDQEIQMFGTGTETRDFIFIEDVIQFLDLLLKTNRFDASVFNIATGIATTIHEATQIFCANAAAPSRIRFNGVIKEGDPLCWQAAIDQLKKIYDIPFTDLKTGLEKTYLWMQSQN